MLKVKKIKPIFTGIITTADRYEEAESINGGALIDANRLKGDIKEYQKVIRVGSSVTVVKEGDLILINPTNYIVKDKLSSENSVRNEFVEPKFSIRLPVIDEDDKEVLLLDQRDIAYIIEESEDIPDPRINLIKPKEKKIIF